jgi:hypothetical protein
MAVPIHSMMFDLTDMVQLETTASDLLRQFTVVVSLLYLPPLACRRHGLLGGLMPRQLLRLWRPGISMAIWKRSLMGVLWSKDPSEDLLAFCIIWRSEFVPENAK